MPLCFKGRHLYICSELGVRSALYFEADRFSKDVPAIYAYIYPTFGFDEAGLSYSRRIALSGTENIQIKTGQDSRDLLDKQTEIQAFLLDHRTASSLEGFIKNSGLFALDVWTSYHLALCYSWQEKHRKAQVLSRKTLSILKILREVGSHVDPIRSDMELLLKHPEEMKRVMVDRATSRVLTTCGATKPR